MNRAVFLDRDGTVTKSPALVTKIEELVLEDRAAEAIKIMNNLNVKVIIVTNQPQVARGLVSEDEVKEINQSMVNELAKHEARIDAIYFCPHHPEVHGDVPEHAKKYRIQCDCRKPSIGMLLQAAEYFNIDLSKSFIVGDRTVDIQAGKNAGCKTILVNTGAAGKDNKHDVVSDYTCNDILDAAKIIMKSYTKAVILAGGKGERLMPLTKDIPKPMIPIAGKPVLEHQIDQIKKHGISEVVLCGSYLIDKIKHHFGDGNNFGIKIYYPHEPQPLGSGGAIKNAASFLDCENFIIMSGDVMNEIDLSSALEFHVKKDALVTLIVRNTDHPLDSDVVIMNDENRIIEYIGRGQELHKTANTGVMIFNKNIINHIPDGFCNIEKDVIFKILHTSKIYGFISSDYIKDMGTHERLESVRKRYEFAS